MSTNPEINSCSEQQLPILSLGSQGEDVKMVQSFLKKLGHYWGSINGYFCLETENSLRVFQKQIGIPSDGIVNTKTWRAITRIHRFLMI